MEARVVDNVIEISGQAEDGWPYAAVRSLTRNLQWHEIASELIDNASAFRKPEQSAVIELGWGKGDRFWAVDKGIGSKEMDAFTKPGKSLGRGLSHGSSTFGTGLFAIECVLSGRMSVSSIADDGVLRVLERQIERTETAIGKTYIDGNGLAAQLGIAEGGTRVEFVKYKYRKPQQKTIIKAIELLGKSYQRAIESGDLILTAFYNGQRLTVSPIGQPVLDEAYSQGIEVDGHRFTIEWGITREPTTDVGCALFYGGKLVDFTTAPCGNGNLGRFFGSITIPRSIGPESMDLLKRSVDYAVMEDVYDRCEELFAEVLQKADELGTDDNERELNRKLESMLTDAVGDKPGHDGQPGDKDKRNVASRDREKAGVEPCGTGRKRQGRKRGVGGADLPFTVSWQNLGEDNAAAKYEIGGNRLTFNRDNVQLSRWKQEDDTRAIAVLGIAYVANIKCSKIVGYGTFDYVYREFLSRLP